MFRSCESCLYGPELVESAEMLQRLVDDNKCRVDEAFDAVARSAQNLQSTSPHEIGLDAFSDSQIEMDYMIDFAARALPAAAAAVEFVDDTLDMASIVDCATDQSKNICPRATLIAKCLKDLELITDQCKWT